MTTVRRKCGGHKKEKCVRKTTTTAEGKSVAKGADREGAREGDGGGGNEGQRTAESGERTKERQMVNIQ